MQMTFSIFSLVLLLLGFLSAGFTFISKQDQAEAMQGYELAAKLGLAAAAIWSLTQK